LIRTISCLKWFSSYPNTYQQERIAMMLCDVCQSIEYDNLDPESEESDAAKCLHHLNFAALSSRTDCKFCAAVVQAIASDEALQTGDPAWREHPIFLRVFPSSTALGDESDKSNLLVYCSPSSQDQREQKVLAIFGLYVERTEEEWRTGKMYDQPSLNIKLSLGFALT
jgi:hypothetical protein